MPSTYPAVWYAQAIALGWQPSHIPNYPAEPRMSPILQLGIPVKHIAYPNVVKRVSFFQELPPYVSA